MANRMISTGSNQPKQNIRHVKVATLPWHTKRDNQSQAAPQLSSLLLHSTPIFYAYILCLYKAYDILVASF